MSEAHFALTAEVKNEAAKEERLAKIEQLENKVFEQAVEVVSGFLDFSTIRPDQEEPPPEWVAQYGQESAEMRLMLAKTAWAPKSLQPAGVDTAVRAMTAISRSKGHRVKLTQNNLNVKIALPAPTSASHPGPVTYEVRDLEQET